MFAKSRTPKASNGIQKLRNSMITKAGSIAIGTPEGTSRPKYFNPCSENPIKTRPTKIIRDIVKVRIT
jgi:hypothetical protein